MSEWWYRWEGVVGAVSGATVAALVVALFLVDDGSGPRGGAAAASGAAPAPVSPLPAATSSLLPAATSSLLPAATSPPSPALAGPVTAPSAPAPRAAPETLALQPGGPAPATAPDDVIEHAFGPVTAGATSAPLPLEVTNPLAYPVEVRAVGTPGSAAFAIRDDTCTAAVLAPRATCRVAVVFAPTTPGSVRSAVEVRLREVCTAGAGWPCGAAAPPDVARTVLPGGRVAVDWTTALGDGWASLRVEGAAG